MNNKHVKSYEQYIDPLYESKLVNGIYKVWPELDEADLSNAQKGYQELFTVALIKFGVKNPTDLDEENKKEFFKWVKDNWNKDKEEASEEAKKLIKIAKDKGLFEPAKDNKNPKQKDNVDPKDASKELK